MQNLVFTTERLTLRTTRKTDLDVVASIWGDREGGKYIPDPYYESGDELIDILDFTEEWPVYYFVATLNSSDEVIATCSIGPECKGDEDWAIGYTVKKDYWGNGYAVDMIHIMISFAQSLGVNSIIAPVAKENKASNRVMEKCGFKVYKESSFTKNVTGEVFPTFIYKLCIR